MTAHPLRALVEQHGGRVPTYIAERTVGRVTPQMRRAAGVRRVLDMLVMPPAAAGDHSPVNDCGGAAAMPISGRRTPQEAAQTTVTSVQAEGVAARRDERFPPGSVPTTAPPRPVPPEPGKAEADGALPSTAGPRGVAPNVVPGRPAVSSPTPGASQTSRSADAQAPAIPQVVAVVDTPSAPAASPVPSDTRAAGVEAVGPAPKRKRRPKPRGKQPARADVGRARGAAASVARGQANAEHALWVLRAARRPLGVSEWARAAGVSRGTLTMNLVPKLGAQVVASGRTSMRKFTPAEPLPEPTAIERLEARVAALEAALARVLL